MAGGAYDWTWANGEPWGYAGWHATTPVAPDEFLPGATMTWSLRAVNPERAGAEDYYTLKAQSPWQEELGFIVEFAPPAVSSLPCSPLPRALFPHEGDRHKELASSSFTRNHTRGLYRFGLRLLECPEPHPHLRPRNKGRDSEVVPTSGLVGCNMPSLTARTSITPTEWTAIQRTILRRAPR